MDAGMTPVRQSIGGLGNIMFKQAYLIGQMLDGTIPDVYLQGEKYWVKHKDKVRDYFRMGIGESIDKVALHIRLGDYLKAQHFHVNLLQTPYYKTAIQMFPNRQFLVFCKDNQGHLQDESDRAFIEVYLRDLGISYEFAPMELSETEDMNLMASCKDIIMANSSFSWWAAYLGDHERVVCPSQWFVDGQQRIELLPNWIII